MTSERTLQRLWLRRLLRLDLASEPLSDGADGLADFQRSALTVLSGALDRFGGAILADEVGMGKTHVALAMMARRGPAVLVAPSALRGMWGRAVARAGLGGAVSFLSHAELSRVEPGTPMWAEPPRLIVVDEAHAFVNPETRRATRLAELAVSAPVLLMTATPIGLSIDGLVALIRLFCPVGSLIPLLGDTLERCARADGSGDLSPVLRALLVRRPRALVRQLYPRGVRVPGPDGVPVRLDFPRRTTVQLRYSLDAAAPGCLQHLLDGIEGLDEELIEAPVPLLRAALLARLESSPDALHASLARLEGFLARRLEAAELGHPLDRARWRRLFEHLHADDDRQRVFPFHFAPAAAGAGPRVDMARLEAQLTQVRALRTALTELQTKNPKLLKLLSFITEELPRTEKVLVFTRFVETATALFEALARALPGDGVALVHGGGGRVAGGARSEEVSRDVVLDTFVPIESGLEEVPAARALRILVATDVLAEGLNLQECPTIVSYDLPFNPRRIVQRHGRNDRLGAPGRSVRSVIMLPGRELEAVLGTLDRLVTRARTAERVLGAAAPLVGLLPGEFDTGWLRQALAHGGDPLADAQSDPFGRGADLLAHHDLLRLERRLPTAPDAPLPHGFHLEATPRHPTGTLFAIRSGIPRDGLRLVFVDDTLAVESQRHLLYPRLRALDTRLATPLHHPPPAHLRMALTWVVQLRQRLRAASLRPHQLPPASALNTLLRQLAALPQPEPWETAAIAQLERLYALLRRPLPTATHALIRRHLDARTPLDVWLPDLIASIPPHEDDAPEEELEVVGFVVFGRPSPPSPLSRRTGEGEALTPQPPLP